MSTQLAAKVQPYLNYIVLAWLVLIAVAAVVGLLLIVRRLRARSMPGDLAMDADAIAFEITAEISRLNNLRRRLSNKDMVAPAGPDVAASVSETAVASPAPSSEADLKAIEQQIEARYLDSIEALRSQLQAIENEKTELKAQIASQMVPITNDAVPIEAAAELKEVQQAKAKLEAEKEEIAAKVLHLEKVLSEYRIFESDFALVKRYKAENERLKKQLTESHQVTEDDINNLFSAIDTDADATTPAPAVGAASIENFFDSEFAANTTKENAEAAAAPPPEASAVAEAAPPVEAPAESTAAPVQVAKPVEAKVESPDAANADETASAIKPIAAQPEVSTPQVDEVKTEAAPAVESSAVAATADEGVAASTQAADETPQAAESNSDVENELEKILAGKNEEFSKENTSEPGLDGIASAASGESKSEPSVNISTAAAATKTGPEVGPTTLPFLQPIPAAKPVTAPTPLSQKAPALKESSPQPSRDFEVDRIREEPQFSGPLDKDEDLEAMAEVAGSDDHLLEEFQKILGGDKT